MNRNSEYEFSSSAVIIENKNRVVLIDTTTGLWMKSSEECYNYIKILAEGNYTIESFLQLFQDDEDVSYMAELIEKLVSLHILVERNASYETDTRDKIEKVYFLITHRCNLRCRHCCVDAGVVDDKEDLTTNEIMICIDRIAALNPQCVIISGGEPLIRKDFRDIIMYAVDEKKLNLHLMTNGCLIDKSLAEFIVQRFSAVSISIDGVDEASCAIIRGKGCYDKVINAVKLLQECGSIEISLSMVEIETNSDYQRSFRDLCKSLKVVPALRKFDLDGRGFENRDILKEAFRDYYKRVGFTSERNVLSRYRLADPKEIGACNCHAIYDNLTVTENGDIYPCNLLNEKDYFIGNILKMDNLRDFIFKRKYITSSAYQNFLKIQPNSIPMCRECKVNYFCFTCPNLVKQMMKYPDDLTVYCNGRKRHLYKIIWNEDIDT